MNRTNRHRHAKLKRMNKLALMKPDDSSHSGDVHLADFPEQHKSTWASPCVSKMPLYGDSFIDLVKELIFWHCIY